MRILIEKCSILDPDAPWGIASGKNILIDGQHIEAVTSGALDTPVDRHVDGRDLLAIPGLVNAHTHSPENLAKASNDRLPFEPWLVHSIWALGDLTPRDYYLAAMLGCIEMIQNGTTAVLDHVGIGPGIGLDHLDSTMLAYRESGMRAGVAPLFRQIANDTKHAAAAGFDLSLPVVENAPAAPDTKAILALLEGFFTHWHGAEKQRLRCWVGPSGMQWFDAGLLHQYFELAGQFGGGVHMHLMETRVQDAIMRDLHGKTAVAFLADEGLLAPNVSLPHSVWITDRDIRRIGDAGAVPIHNPAANLRLGSGLSPIGALLEAGILPGLGADGSKSSDHQNMFGHMHLAALVHNLTDPRPDRWLSSRNVVRMATEGGASALMRGGMLGQIKPGYLADITLLDLQSVGLAPLNDAYHHLAYCELGRAVHSVIIDGAVVLDAGRITTFDADAIIAEVRESAIGRTLRNPLPPAWKAAMERHLAYQQHVVTTPFEQD